MNIITIKQGQYYFNKLGQLIFIAGEIAPDTKWYRRGFRFVDHRGSYYNAQGSVQSKFWADLDVAHEVVIELVETAKVEKLQSEMKNFLIRKAFVKKLSAFCLRALHVIIAAEFAAISYLLVRRMRTA